MSKNLDIVFIKPGSQKQLYGSLSDAGLTGIEPPLWAALLAGHLRRLGYAVALFDAEIENWDYQQTVDNIIQADPLLAVVVVSGTNPSASTMNMTGAGAILSLLREASPRINTLLTGLHPSALPERTVIEEDVDFVGQGEGFQTIPTLLEALRSNCDCSSIPGLWYRHDDHVRCNPPAVLVSKLDDLAPPAWDMLDMTRYRAHNWHCFGDIENRRPYGVLYTSLGCPYRCNFCCINTLFGKNIIRYRSARKVVADLDILVNTYGITNIKIMDEMFALSEKRVVELCDLIIERRYDLNMWAYARVNTVTEHMLVKMKQAGINWLAYGFESASKRVIAAADKNYRTELVEDVVQMTYECGIHICANYIFGLPEDDRDSMNETLDLMLEINAEWANIYCAMAYPGSQLYQDALAGGWALPENWQDYSQYSYNTMPLPTKHLDGAEVLAFRDAAFHRYYDNPRYLSSIQRKFGPETVSHIQQMSANKLQRKYAHA